MARKSRKPRTLNAEYALYNAWITLGMAHNALRFGMAHHAHQGAELALHYLRSGGTQKVRLPVALSGWGCSAWSWKVGGWWRCLGGHLLAQGGWLGDGGVGAPGGWVDASLAWWMVVQDLRGARCAVGGVGAQSMRDGAGCARCKVCGGVRRMCG